MSKNLKELFKADLESVEKSDAQLPQLSRRKFIEYLSGLFGTAAVMRPDEAHAFLSFMMRFGGTQGPAALYVDDVFSVMTYAGSGAAKTIVNGINLSGKGGMVWTKCRSAAMPHRMVDSDRSSGGAPLEPGTTNAAFFSSVVSSLNSNGYQIASGDGAYNNPGSTYVSYTFRKAAKFFDVVTWTGDGASDRSIAHSLGAAPGMVIAKSTSSSGDWYVSHLGLTGSAYMKFNKPNAQLDAGAPRPIFADATNIYVHSSGNPWLTNVNGVSYVAYLFGHDTSAGGIIQCGTFTGSNTNVDLGWEPQFLLTREIDSGNHWRIADTMRGMSNSSIEFIFSETSDAAVASGNWEYPTATGFNSGSSSRSGTWLYLAIRRSNKTVSAGSQVFKTILQTGTNANPRIVSGVGFAPDLCILGGRSTSNAKPLFYDRVRGAVDALGSYSASAEGAFGLTGVTLESDGMTIASIATALNGGEGFYHYFFKRAAGFFDIVAYAGTGSGGTKSHGLGVVPEMMIFKNRSASADWGVYHSALGSAAYLLLNSTAAVTGSTYQLTNSTAPTATQFTTWNNSMNNASGNNYVAYLFASLPGISKVGSYVGNGSSLSIDCGFATTARFVLVKRVDAVGDWYFWDSERGINTGTSEPHSSMNNLNAEASDDSVDPATNGFVVKQIVSTNINVNGASYIFLAIS